MNRLLHHAFAALFCLLALLGGLRAAAEDRADGDLRITYLANEGFLFEAGETRVLVDALFGDGLPEYPVVPPAVRAELEGARGRFAGVDLILVSHAHADHFDPVAVARHLRANPAAVFLSTDEALAAVREELGDVAAGLELLAPRPAKGKAATVELAGVTVQALNLHHGRVPIENLGLVVRLGGLEVLHVGDTSAEASDLRPYSDLLESVDVWLLPDWLMGDPDWEAARAGAADTTWLVNMHLAAPTAPPAWFGSAGTHAGRISRIREALPDVWIPVEPLSSRLYPPP